MATLDKLVKVFEGFGKELVQDLQSSLRKKVTFGGGDSRLSNKIQFKIIHDKDKLVFQLLMPEYGFIIDKGRGELGDTPTPPRTKKRGGVSKEGQKNIKEWAKRKGIVGKFRSESLKARIEKQNEAKAKNKTKRKYKTLKQMSFEKAATQLGYLVSRKIARKGFKGNHFYTDVIKSLETGELTKKISEIMKQDVLIEIKGK